MKNKISDRERLLHILDSINIIKDFSEGLTYEQYSEDLKLRLALVKLLEIIGEAASGLTNETIRKFTDVEWPVLKSVRNILVHEYFGIDYKIIWNAVNQKIPELKKNIEKILTEL